MKGATEPNAGAPPTGLLGARVAGGLLLVVGLAVGAESTTFDVAFLTDPIVPKAMPGLAAVVFVLAGLRQLLRPDRGAVWPGRDRVRRIVGACVAFLAYAALLPFLGFMVSTTAVVAVLSMLYGGPARWSIVTAAGLAIGLWFLFSVLLGLPLPVGDAWMR